MREADFREDGGHAMLGSSVMNVDIEKPPFVDKNGYVNGGTLVASLSGEVAIALNPNFIVRLRAPYLTATISKQAGKHNLTNGLVAGRWPVQGMLAQFGSFVVFNTQLCTDHLAYKQVKAAVCNAADILSALGTLTDPCDAIPTAFAFTAEPALIGKVFPAGTATMPCPPATDPANDNCSK